MSAVWSCPVEGCGYHIADGPVPDGEPSTLELIQEHQREHELYCPVVVQPAGEDPQQCGLELPCPAHAELAVVPDVVARPLLIRPDGDLCEAMASEQSGDQAEPATPTTAGHDQLDVRLDAAQAVYPLPPIVHRRHDEHWMRDLDLSEATRVTLPPIAHLYVTDRAGLHAWAAHLGLTVHVTVTQDEGGGVWRDTKARGRWLGWAIAIHPRDGYQRVSHTTTPALVRRAATPGTVW